MAFNTYNEYKDAVSSADNNEVTVLDELKLNVGDKVAITNQTGSSITLLSNDIYNTFSISSI